MRKNRVIEQNRCYHLVSRLAHRAFFLDDEEKDRVVALMRRVEVGVQAIMSYYINKRRTAMKRVMMAVCMVALTGCKTGMFAPRTGELFQTTRMCPGPGLYIYTAPLMVWVWGVQKRGGEWTIPIGIVGIPIAAAGFVVDECVVSPLVDLVCLPYDLCQPYHGCYLRIVDEDGRPVQGAKIHGHFDLVGKAFSGTTDAAGEFKINRLHDVKGYFWASCDNHASWYQGRDFDVANAKAESDGKIVFQYALSKMNPGGWKAKKDISREEVLKLLPGKWSVDHESRVWLQHGFNCRYANDCNRHCLTLEASGKVDSHVPQEYEFYFGARNHSDWNAGIYSAWRLQGKDDVDEAKARRNHERLPSGWLWRVHLSDGPKNTSCSDSYYLGEDEKGLYLSPGPFSEWDSLSEKLSLKYRKVKE
jgi:hypothetical protein